MVRAMSSTARPIRRVAVLGAGVMGSGIAAHCANAGIPVVLLDIVPPKNTDPSKAARDAFATGALAKTLKAKPAAFMHPRNAVLVSRSGNLEDDLAKTADCDLVIEAVIERLDIKQALFAKLEANRARRRSSPRTPRACGSPTCSRAGPRASSKQLRRDALLQPRPLHEAPRAGRRAGDDPGRARSACRSFGEEIARQGRSCSARTRRTSSATASARTR
jgi:hypothetical protein